MLPAKVSAFRHRLGRTTRAIAVSLWENEILLDASAMAFSLFLASIPLMALMGSVVADVLSGDPRALTLLSRLIDLAPSEVRKLVDRNLARASKQALAPLFLVGTLWLSANAFHDAITVFERALDAERRSWLHKRLISLGCVVALLALFASVGWMAVAKAGGIVALLLSALAGVDDVLPRVVASCISAATTGLLVAAFFRIAVRHRRSPPRVWPGAIITVAIGIVASFAFASYARTLASYAVFYGSLAAVAIFLLWLWMMCIALLVGVVLNATLERGVRK